MYKIYCSINYLKKFFLELQNYKLQANGATYELLQVLINTYELFKSKEIIIDEDIKKHISLEENEIISPYLSALLKNNILTICPEVFSQIKNNDSVFFQSLSSNSLIFCDFEINEIKKLEEKYGVIILTSKNFRGNAILFKQHIEIFINGENKDWNFLKNINHPFNLLIINDSYLVEGRYRNWHLNNLKQFLKSIIPIKLEIPLHLTIITRAWDDDNKCFDKNKANYFKKELQDFILEFPIKIELTILFTGVNYIHDRFFITNYFLANSGYGFTLFRNNQCTKNTHLAVNPRSKKNISRLYDSLIKECNPKINNNLVSSF